MAIASRSSARGASRLATVLGVALASLSACATQGVRSVRAASVAVRPLAGQIDYGPLREAGTSVQSTTVSQVASGATVALLDPSTGVPIATTLSMPGGSFILGLPSSAAAPIGQVEVLEAYKGLGNNAIDNPAIRVRTLVSYDGTQWQSLASTALAGGNILISPETTALCIMASVQGLQGAALSSLLGSIVPSTTLTGLVYQPPATSTLSSSAFQTVLGLVDGALAATMDPISAVSYDGASYIGLAPPASPSASPMPSMPPSPLPTM